jgi:hypothetical protein
MTRLFVEQPLALPGSANNLALTYQNVSKLDSSVNFKVDLHIFDGELFGHSEDSDMVNYTLLVSGTPLTTIVLGR